MWNRWMVSIRYGDGRCWSWWWRESRYNRSRFRLICVNHRNRYRCEGGFRYRYWQRSWWNRWLVRGWRRVWGGWRHRVGMVVRFWCRLHWLADSKVNEGLDHMVGVLG